MNKTKKVMAAILLSSLVFIAGCTPETLPEVEPESMAETAENSKIAYENEELGIRIELPEGWVSDMGNELAEGSEAYIRPEGVDYFAIILYVTPAEGKSLQEQTLEQEAFYEYLLEIGEFSSFEHPEDPEESTIETFYMTKGSTNAIEFLEKNGDFFVAWRVILDERAQGDTLATLASEAGKIIDNSYI